MSTQNSIETEVKIPVPSWSNALAAERLADLGFSVKVPRVFEANFVYDTPALDLRNRQSLLRLRRVGNTNTLTWKGAPLPGPHKSRTELETSFSSFDTLHQILEHLGYQTCFRYEKFRTEYTAPGSGTVTFDETPIGHFLELEGPAAWIDSTASRLGFTPKDYVLESYARLYLAHCEKQGLQPSNMLFAEKA